MSTQATIHNYYLIIDRLWTAPCPTKKELLDYLKRDDHDELVNSMRSLDMLPGMTPRLSVKTAFYSQY